MGCCKNLEQKALDAVGKSEWSAIPKHFSFRQKCYLFLTLSRVGYGIDTFQVLLSLVACGFYIAETYDDTPPSWFTVVEIVLTLLFTADYLLRLYVAPIRWRYVLSFFAMVDLLAIVPVYLSLILQAESGGLNFVRFIRILRALRILRTYRLISGNISPIARQVLMMLFIIVSIVFVSAGFFQFAESELGGSSMSFHDAMYFVIVTISTVGYGGIVPTTVYGEAVVVCTIVAAIMIIPYQTRKLIFVFEIQGKHNSDYKIRRDTPHVVVCGHITFAGLVDFLREIFHEDHGVFSKLHVVILTPELPDHKIKTLLTNPLYDEWIYYIRGSSMNELDLYRAGLDCASACFVLADKLCPNADVEDSRVILRVLSIKNYSKSVKVFAQIINPSHKVLAEAAGADYYFCVDEIKLDILAKSCLCPGFITLVTNLFRSYSDREVAVSRDSEPWTAEYWYGSSYEVYKIRKLPEVFWGRSFRSVAKALFRKFGVPTFAIGAHQEEGEVFCIFPGSAYVLSPMDTLYIFGRDQNVAYAIQEMRETPGTEATTATKTGRRGTISAVVDSGVPPMEEPQSDSDVGDALRNVGNAGDKLEGGGDQLRVGGDGFGGAKLEVLEDTGGSETMVTDGPQIEMTERPRLASLASRRSIETIPESTDSPGRGSVGYVPASATARYVLGKQGSIASMTMPSPNSIAPGNTDLDLSAVDDDMFSNHIICCGSVTSLHHFIKPLRHECLNEHMPIVILDSKPPNDEWWAWWTKEIQHYSDVFFIQGSPLDTADLERAGVERARSVVILADRNQLKQVDGDHDEDYFSVESESNVLMTVLSIENVCQGLKHVNTVAELISSDNLSALNARLMRGEEDENDSLEGHTSIKNKVRSILCRVKSTSRNRNIYSASREYEGTPFFAAGRVYSATMLLDTLLCQAYFNHEILRVTEQLVKGGPDNLPNNCKRTFLYQIKIPPPLLVMDYGALIEYLLDRDMLALGIYRSHIGMGSPLPYVYTAPAHNCMLFPEDRVFILATHEPTYDDLCAQAPGSRRGSVAKSEV